MKEPYPKPNIRSPGQGGIKSLEKRVEILEVVNRARRGGMKLKFPDDLAIHIDLNLLREAQAKCYIESGKENFISSNIPWLLKILFPNYYRDVIKRMIDSLFMELEIRDSMKAQAGEVMPGAVRKSTITRRTYKSGTRTLDIGNNDEEKF